MDVTETYFSAWSEVNRLRIGSGMGFLTIIEMSTPSCGTDLMSAMC